MPIEINGETRYLGNLNSPLCLNSLAVSDDGRIAVIAVYSDKPRFPYIEPDDPYGLVLVREEPDGTLVAVATDEAPIVGYPSGRFDSFPFPLLISGSQTRPAFRSDGSYRTLARLEFDPPDSALTGKWIVDIDEQGIHPVLRHDWHELPDGRMLETKFDDSAQADFSLPIGGVGQMSGKAGRVAWRLDDREVVVLFNTLDDPLTNSSRPFTNGQYHIALLDGTVLVPSSSGKRFYARLGTGGATVEFEVSPGQFPLLPDGSEQVVFSTTLRGHATQSGYFVPLRAFSNGTFYHLTLANIGSGIQRFLDNETFSQFPPFDPPQSRQTIFASNNLGDVVAWRYTEAPGEVTSRALYYRGQDEAWTPVAVSDRAAQLGVFSGYTDFEFNIGSPIRRDITRDGVFLFGVNYFSLLSRGEIGWSPEDGYRLIFASGDFLTLPSDPARPVQPLWRRAGQDPLSTTIFAIAQYDDDPEIEFKIAIIRQPIHASIPLADLNRDGEVNALDLNIVIRGMSGGGIYEFSGDIDFDGIVDENDLQMLLDQWGQR